MDENLTDNERVEELKRWWRENGWFLIGGVALGALVLFGYNQYTAYRDHRYEEAGALFQVVKDAKDPVAANATLQKMRADFPGSAYTSQAGLLVAGMLVVPIAVLMVGVAWGSIRWLDMGQRVELVVRMRPSEKRDA